MSQFPEPVPQRIGDAERDEAAELLREHLAAGRLDREEFDDRVGRALTARTMADLVPLFEDLPGPRPGSGLAAAAPWPGSPAHPPEDAPTARHHAGRALSIAAAVAWPLTIMVCFMVGWRFWWLIFIPIAISSVAGNRGRPGGR